MGLLRKCPRTGQRIVPLAAAARYFVAEKRVAELLAEIDRETEPGSKKARLQEALRQAYGVEPFLATQPA